MNVKEENIADTKLAFENDCGSSFDIEIDGDTLIYNELYQYELTEFTNKTLTKTDRTDTDVAFNEYFKLND